MGEATALSQSVRDALRCAARRLNLAGIEGAERDVRVLMRHCLGVDMAGLIAAEKDAMPAGVAAAFEAVVCRRESREPVARIIGTRLFFGRAFTVTPQVLDPRPETEILVEQVLADFLDDGGPKRFADIGTGSGAIALTILAERRRFCGVGVDISAEALRCARKNADDLDLGERFRAMAGDMLEPLEGRLDFIVANPPYIATGELDLLAPEVRLFDPVLALDGGEDGLSAYRNLLANGRKSLVDGGRMYLEAGKGQLPAIRELAVHHGWGAMRAVNDLDGVERVLVVER